MTVEYPKNNIAEGPDEFKCDPSDFMQLIGNSMPMVEKTNDEKKQPLNYDPSQVGPSDSDKEAMKTLLEKFHKSTENTVDYTVRNNKEVQKALLTESNSGKEWHILLNENKNKSYKIVNDSTKKAFFDDVTLYESAQKICDSLENGYAMNSQKVQKILYYDNMYREYFAECQNFKRLYKKAKLNEEKSRMRILQDRFEVTKEKAIKAKNTIKQLR